MSSLKLVIYEKYEYSVMSEADSVEKQEIVEYKDCEIKTVKTKEKEEDWETFIVKRKETLLEIVPRRAGAYVIVKNYHYWYDPYVGDYEVELGYSCVNSICEYIVFWFDGARWYERHFSRLEEAKRFAEAMCAEL